MATLVADQGIMTLVTVAIIALCAVIALYVLYSVIWRAVRRGLREFHRPAEPTPRLRRAARRAAAKVPNFPPSEWV